MDIAAAIGNIGLYLLVYVAGKPVLQWLADLIPDPAILNRILEDGTSVVGFSVVGLSTCCIHNLQIVFDDKPSSHNVMHVINFREGKRFANKASDLLP